MSDEPTALAGRALVLGDHVNADVLHPSSFFSLDAGKVASGFLGAARRDDATRRDPGTPLIVVAGRNFGCGSSRETTVQAFRLAGVRAVVARSFGRLFERNLLNVGLAGFVLRDTPAEAIRDGEELEVDEGGGVLLRRAAGERLALAPHDPYLAAVRRAGGLLELLETLEP